jgi:hypothetical protein
MASPAFTLRAALTVAVAALAGCETTAPRCAFTACGGALDGQWTIKERCPGAAPECPGVRVDTSAVTLEGSLTFSGGSNYQASVRQKGTIVATVPLACYPTASGCAAVEGELRAAASRDPTSAIGSVVCSGTSVCTCNETLRDRPVSESGSYRIVESRVILTSAAGDATTNDYCVSGSQLKLRASPPGLPGSGDVLILTKP